MGLAAGVVLIAGPSGSGKSYIARRTGLPVLCLDDFYKNVDDPTLPRADGRVDWESPSAWNAAAAVEAITRLAHDGRAEVPVYAISADRQVGTRLLDLNGAPLFIAEGIFAAEICADCRSRGLLAGAYALRRPRALTFVRRLSRDLPSDVSRRPCSSVAASGCCGPSPPSCAARPSWAASRRAARGSSGRWRTWSPGSRPSRPAGYPSNRA